MIPSIRQLLRDGARRAGRQVGAPVKLRDHLPTERRILFVTADNRILRSQMDPFRRYAAAIRRMHGAAIHEIAIERFESWARKGRGGFDTVVLQPWFDIDLPRLDRLLTASRDLGARRVVFLDGFAPTDLRFAAPLEGRVDLYVKKHVLRDRSAYGQPTVGDTNLTDYYARKYGMEMPVRQWPVSVDFLGRLVVGPTFFTHDDLWGQLLTASPPPRQDIDLHARLGVGEDWGWYSRMRQEAMDALQPLRDLKLVEQAGVAKSVYMLELARSKMCFSPFGFGEVAWRDFEAAISGSLLLKPDCSHIETSPDIFVPFETYVPLRWDLSDLEDKARYYLSHADERERITRNARDVLTDYVRSDAFLVQMHPVLDRTR